ncbi:MAG: phosphoribosyltransferase [Mycoplasma sp.]
MKINNNEIDVIYTFDEIMARVKELSTEMNDYYADKDQVLVVPVLDGSIVFVGQILPMLDFEMNLRATKISSYLNNRKSNGEPKIHISIDMSLVKDKTILILEDLIDRGHTLSMFKKYLLDLGAKDVKICVLFNKKVKNYKEREITPDWNGFFIEDEWVAGFGIDSESKYRNFPHFGRVIK